PACACDPTTAQRLRARGYVWIASAFLVCPCHLPITLWLVGSAVAGPAPGPWVPGPRLLAARPLPAAWVRGPRSGRRPPRAAHGAAPARRTVMTLIVLRRMVAPAIVLLAALAAAPGFAVPRPASPAASAADSIRALEEVRGKALLAADTLTLSRLVAGEFIE